MCMGCLLFVFVDVFVRKVDMFERDKREKKTYVNYGEKK